MKRYNLIVREPRAKLRCHNGVLTIESPFEEQRVGLRRIERLCLNYRARCDIKDVIAMARIFPVYFIDYRGAIVARVSFQV
jgi:hypothetical protein